MKKITVLLIFMICSPILKAQTYTDAGTYITYISTQCKPIMEEYMSYSSAVAHGKNARKIDNKRQVLLQSIKTAIQKVTALSPFKDDKRLRDSTVSFLHLYNSVLIEDYGKILNLEDIAEESYDAMEAYLLAQDLAGEKLEKAHQLLKFTERTFAESNQVLLLESMDNELSIKLLKNAQVNAYHRIVYLLFFKSYKQEVYMLDAIKQKNSSSIEQNKNALLKVASQGLLILDTLNPFLNDKTLVNTAKQVLEFHKLEAKEKISTLTNFYLLEENYLKSKKQFELLKPEERTQEDVDAYNKNVKEYNAAVSNFNSLNNELYQKRNQLIDLWNTSSLLFFSTHVPKYK